MKEKTNLTVEDFVKVDPESFLDIPNVGVKSQEELVELQRVLGEKVKSLKAENTHLTKRFLHCV